MKKPNKCPRCGERSNIFVGKSILHRLKPWFLLCGYCRFRSNNARTKWGAKRKWNKATNIVDVWEWRGRVNR